MKNKNGNPSAFAPIFRCTKLGVLCNAQKNPKRYNTLPPNK